MYLIMQAFELRLQLLAKRLNGATKGATGYRDLVGHATGQVVFAHSRLVGTVDKVAAMKPCALKLEMFDRRVRQPLAFFHESRLIDEVSPHRK
jgi:hypothetical protein